MSSIWNLTGVSAALLLMRLSNVMARQWCENSAYRLSDFKTFLGMVSYQLMNRGLGFFQIQSFVTMNSHKNFFSFLSPCEVKPPLLLYIPRNMHTVFALLCFVVVIHWLIFPYPSGLLHWHCGNLTIAPVPAKQPWWIWINTSCEFIMNDCITTTKQSTTKPCAYFLGYTAKLSANHI